MKLVPLENLTSLVSSGSTPKGGAKVYLEDGPVMLIRSQNVLMRNLELSDVAFLSEDVAAKMKRTFVQRNDVLLNITGASIGRVATFEMPNVRANVNQHVCIIRPIPELLHHRYLMYFLAQRTFQRSIDNLQNGGTRQALTFPQIRDFSIPLPPIEEQRRIAAIADQADAIRRKRKEAIRLTESLLRSAFLDMFGDPVTNPKGWEISTIGDIAEVKTGKTPSRDESDNYGGEVRWIKITEVRDSVIYETEEHLSSKGAAQLSVFPKDTILVAMYGQGATRGRTALLGQPCTTNQACAAILPNRSYLPEYLWMFLRLSYERLRDLGHGGNQPNLNLSMIKNFQVPLPPLSYQNTYKSVFFSLKGKLTRNLISEQELNSLFSSLLQCAFRGEL